MPRCHSELTDAAEERLAERDDGLHDIGDAALSE
jgi:hypothetical protein